MSSSIVIQARRAAGGPRAIAWLAVVVAALVGCSGPASPAPSPTPAAATPAPAGSIDPQTVYAAVAGQVEQLRGLRPKADIAPVLIDEATLRANLTAEFDRQNPAALVRANEEVLTALGLLQAGTSLRDAYLDLQSGQVIGYYSPDQDKLFLVSRSGAVGPTQRVTYAHEFTHQLQDQNFDLDSLGLDATDQGDRSLARLALVEGDAVSTQTGWMQANLTPQELGQVLADSSDPEAMAALQRAPAVLRATSLFPYTDGYAFVNRLLAEDGLKAVNAAFARPPDSTEQILHPGKFLTREAPIEVTLPASLTKSLAKSLGGSWTLAATDTFGELLLRTWLTESKVATATATTAAAGWGGDRLALLTGPHGEVAVALVTRWDTAADADEFAHAAGAAIAHVRGVARVVSSASGSDVVIAVAPSEAVLGPLLLALGQ